MTLQSAVACAILTLIWVLLLRVLYNVKNQAAFITVGMLGLFLLMIVFVMPVATSPLSRAVAALAGLVGRATGTFAAYFKYGILFITTPEGSITLQVDFECSGIIETMVFISILAFFKVYTIPERLVVGVFGFLYILVANALRIVLICLSVHFGGMSAYYVAHTYLGRIFFYAATVVLYFYVFTKPQVVRMKVGSFSYDKTNAAAAELEAQARSEGASSVQQAVSADKQEGPGTTKN